MCMYVNAYCVNLMKCLSLYLYPVKLIITVRCWKKQNLLEYYGIMKIESYLVVCVQFNSSRIVLFHQIEGCVRRGTFLSRILGFLCRHRFGCNIV